MLMTRYTHGTFALTTILLSVALLGVEYGSAFAQGKLDARYSVTLAGLSIGRGSWVIDSGRSAGRLRSDDRLASVGARGW